MSKYTYSRKNFDFESMIWKKKSKSSFLSIFGIVLNTVTENNFYIFLWMSICNWKTKRKKKSTECIGTNKIFTQGLQAFFDNHFS